LGQGDQEVLLLVAWDELRREQAAKVLGVSTGTFAVRLHRARRRFARALAAQDGIEPSIDERPLASEVM
jgi:RNA polymerase sigma-70 factor (ECF subfamily)